MLFSSFAFIFGWLLTESFMFSFLSLWDVCHFLRFLPCLCALKNWKHSCVCEVMESRNYILWTFTGSPFSTFHSQPLLVYIKTGWNKSPQLSGEYWQSNLTINVTQVKETTVSTKQFEKQPMLADVYHCFGQEWIQKWISLVSQGNRKSAARFSRCHLCACKAPSVTGKTPLPR